jgi:hypothetical protein
MAEFFQWVTVREGPGAAYSYETPPEIDPFLDDLWAGRRLTKPPPAFHVALAPPFTGALSDDFPVLDHHSLMVLRDVVYCVDRDKSHLELDVENPRIIEAIHSLAVDEARLDGCPLFRLGENRQVVLAHQSVADAVREAGFTGVRFYPVDGSVPLPAPVDQVGGEWPPEVVEYVSNQYP